MEIIEIFNYIKSNDKYWDGPKFYYQFMTKTLLIIEAFYPKYSLLFLFDNTTSLSVFLQNALCIVNINKKIRGKQPILQNKWYKKYNIQVVYSIVF